MCFIEKKHGIQNACVSIAPTFSMVFQIARWGARTIATIVALERG